MLNIINVILYLIALVLFVSNIVFQAQAFFFCCVVFQAYYWRLTVLSFCFPTLFYYRCSVTVLIWLLALPKLLFRVEDLMEPKPIMELSTIQVSCCISPKFLCGHSLRSWRSCEREKTGESLEKMGCPKTKAGVTR